MTDERLAPNFWLSELLHSETAVRHRLDNYPDAVALANLRNHTGPGLQRVRDLLGVPVLVSSGYRSPAVNQRIGGSTRSQHMDGLAVDFTAPSYGTPYKVARAIMEHASLVKYDQLILEFGRWVHCSWSPRPRGMVLTIDHNGTRHGLA